MNLPPPSLPRFPITKNDDEQSISLVNTTIPNPTIKLTTLQRKPSPGSVPVVRVRLFPSPEIGQVDIAKDCRAPDVLAALHHLRFRILTSTFSVWGLLGFRVF